MRWETKAEEVGFSFLVVVGKTEEKVVEYNRYLKLYSHFYGE